MEIAFVYVMASKMVIAAEQLEGANAIMPRHVACTLFILSSWSFNSQMLA